MAYVHNGSYLVEGCTLYTIRLDDLGIRFKIRYGRNHLSVLSEQVSKHDFSDDFSVTDALKTKYCLIWHVYLFSNF